MAKLANEIEIAAAVDSASMVIKSNEVVDLIKAKSTKELAKIGVTKQSDGTLKVTDEGKFTVYFDSIQPADPDDQQANDDETGIARLWAKSNKAVAEVEISDDDLLEGVVKGVSFRRSRLDRKVITGVGFRIKTVENGVVRNRRISVHINYAKAIVAGETRIADQVKDSDVLAWGIALKEKGLLIQVTRQKAGETGYFRAESKLNDREKTALAACTNRDAIMQRKLGTVVMYGFEHITSGTSYSISSELNPEEVEVLNAKFEASEIAVADAMKQRMVKEADVQAEETRLEHQLTALKRLVDMKLITPAEYNTRRTAILAKI